MMRYFSIWLLLFLFLGSVGGYAQKLKFDVAEFSLDQSDLSARSGEYSKKDGNGNLYAIVKVMSTNPDDKLGEYRFNFGNQAHELIKNEDDILWLHVQRGAKSVTISRTGYATLQRYDLGQSLEAGRVYVMTLTSEAKKVQKQWVQFSVSPLDAKAMIWYKPAGKDAKEEFLGMVDETGQRAKSLPYGEYSYRVVAENYKESVGAFRLSGNSTLVEKVLLIPSAARVTLNVSADADIYIDNVLKGQRTWTGQLGEGQYLVECRQANHKPTSQNLVITSTDSRTVALEAPTPILGTLAVSSLPLGASINIDGKSYGKTPQNIDVLVGEHTLTLSMNGYKESRKSVTAKEDDITELEVSLEKVVSASQSSSSTARSNSGVEGATGTINGHEYIDLGLPSGLKWATCNVGASKAEDYGDYYAWGETSTKSDYSSDNSTTYGKTTNQLKSAGIVGSDGNLTAAYDAAHAKWGGTWRTPTLEEIKELMNNTTTVWTTLNGIQGRLVKSKTNGNSIFLPAAGYRYGTSLSNAGSGGDYWSSTPYESFSYRAYGLYFSSSDYYWYDSLWRYYGFSVRPVSE